MPAWASLFRLGFSTYGLGLHSVKTESPGWGPTTGLHYLLRQVGTCVAGVLLNSDSIDGLRIILKTYYRPIILVQLSKVLGWLIVRFHDPDSDFSPALICPKNYAIGNLDQRSLSTIRPKFWMTHFTFRAVFTFHTRTSYRFHDPDSDFSPALICPKNYAIGNLDQRSLSTIRPKFWMTHFTFRAVFTFHTRTSYRLRYGSINSELATVPAGLYSINNMTTNYSRVYLWISTGSYVSRDAVKCVVMVVWEISILIISQADLFKRWLKMDHRSSFCLVCIWPASGSTAIMLDSFTYPPGIVGVYSWLIHEQVGIRLQIRLLIDSYYFRDLMVFSNAIDTAYLSLTPLGIGVLPDIKAYGSLGCWEVRSRMRELILLLQGLLGQLSLRAKFLEFTCPYSALCACHAKEAHTCPRYLEQTTGFSNFNVPILTPGTGIETPATC
ncbi:hypothetical protein VNO77_19524 [Canavalia gladiata]|uniref:Uncharacterized protein n=1 Tax=Canavalia gladiata TaxID=3824 RepID=A0AAN9LMN0_CANGL